MVTAKALNKSLVIVLTTLTIFILLGCGRRVGEHSGSSAKVYRWPSKPEPARIQFLNAISNPEDMGIHEGFWLKLFGKKENNNIQHPISIGISKTGKLFFSDMIGEIRYFDPNSRKSVRQLKTVSTNLQSPVSLSIGVNDTVYVVDSELGSVFVYDRELTPKRVLPTKFTRPTAVCFDTFTNHLFISDAAANLLYECDLAGNILTEFGRSDSQVEKLNTPTHLCITKDYIYITDAYGFRIVVMNRSGKFVRAFGHAGTALGSFARPKGIAVDSEEHIYVADALFNNIQIFDSTGTFLLFFGGSGGDAPGEMCLPTGIHIDSQDRIYVADTYNSRIQIFRYLRVGQSGGIK